MLSLGSNVRVPSPFESQRFCHKRKNMNRKKGACEANEGAETSTSMIGWLLCKRIIKGSENIFDVFRFYFRE